MPKAWIGGGVEKIRNKKSLVADVQRLLPLGRACASSEVTGNPSEIRIPAIEWNG
jgi:hypothetical protein